MLQRIQFQLPPLSAVLRSPVAALIVSATFLLGGCGGGGGGGSAPVIPVETATFSVSGTVSGLVAGTSVSIVVNGGSPLQLGANGGFTLPQTFQMNAAYSVSIGAQPAGQICSILNGSATVNSNVTNLLVNCLTPPPPETKLTIGGSISGMTAGAQIGLLNNGVGLINVNANAAFSFASTSGAPYSISIANNPAGQLCGVTNSTGVATTSQSDISITCRTAQLSIVTGSGGGSGRSDGTGTNARFNRPQGNAIDSAGNVYVADWYNQIIRKITPAGIVTTLAGTYGVTGATDGTGVAAQFCHPLALAIDKSGFLYVTDSCNETIRKISPLGVVSTLAGKAGEVGSADGTGAQARFGMLSGISIDASGTLYVSDFGNSTIRKVSPDGVVTTFAGRAGVSGYADGTSSAAMFFGPNGIAIDGQGIVYVTDSYNQLVRRITPTGTVSTLAGTLRTRGNLDGQGSAAAFSLATPQTDDLGMPPLSGLAVNGAGTLFLTDYFNNTVRTVSPSGLVTTVVGGSLGYLDGPGTAARLRTPSGISADAAGNIYVSEDNNWTVRKISPSMLTSTLAGRPLIQGSTDGAKDSASFHSLSSVAADAAGNLYVADSNNNVVRKVSKAGVTTTFAGTAGMIGTTDGMGADARFYSPSGIAVDGAGTVYVSDSQANTIRKITPDGLVSTLAGDSFSLAAYADGVGKEAKFFVPMGLAIDAKGNVYVADEFNSAVRKITPSGLVTTIGDGRTATGANGVAVDAAGNVYFSSATHAHIKKIRTDGTVTVLAGSANMNQQESGSADGLGTAARFSFPASIAVDAKGNVYVADSGNCTIRMVTSIGAVSTLAGVPGRCEVHEGPLPALLPPLVGLTLTPDGQQMIISGNNAILRISGF